tara:strand:- start:41 stop:436 length:396 start_codon:yes stop_codon:yes gene_type:complete
MNQEIAEAVISILRNFHDKRDGMYFSDSVGICANLDYALQQAQCSKLTTYKLMSYYAIGWEPHTGDENYPIAGYYDRDENDNKVLWVGKQLELRQSLIRYIIAKLEADFIPTSGNYRWNKADKNLMDMWWN